MYVGTDCIYASVNIKICFFFSSHWTTTRRLIALSTVKTGPKEAKEAIGANAIASYAFPPFQGKCTTDKEGSRKIAQCMKAASSLTYFSKK